MPAPTYTRLIFVPPELATYSVSMLLPKARPHGCDPTGMPLLAKVFVVPCQISSLLLLMLETKTLPCAESIAMSPTMVLIPPYGSGYVRPYTTTVVSVHARDIVGCATVVPFETE